MFFLGSFPLHGLHKLSPVVDTILISVVWVLSLASRRVSDTILRLGIVNLAVAILTSVGGVLMAETVVVILVVGVGIIGEVVDGSAVSCMTLTVGVKLIGVSVFGQIMTFSSGSSLAATEKATQETTLGAVAGGVVVGGTRAKALLLAMMTGKGNLCKNRQDEEDTGLLLVLIPILLTVLFETYMATMATARQADCSLQAVR